MTQSTTDSASIPLPPPKERRRLREAKSLSEEQVAAAVGVTRATVRNWETGRSTPRGRKLQVYARLLTEAGPKESSAIASAPVRAPAPKPDPEQAPESRPEPPKSKPRPESHAAAPTPSHRPKQSHDTTERPAKPPTIPANPAPPHPAPPWTPPPPPPLSPAEAFDALYAYAAPALVRQTYLLTGRTRLSHESVERAFHLAWQHWPEVAVDRDPAGWVRAAAYEYAMSPWQHLRRVHRHPDVPPPEPDRGVLLNALLELPPPYRRTLLLYDGVGLDLPETAAETEASTPATANRVLHARAALVERVPELDSADTLHDRLTALANAGPVPQLLPAQAVRTGSERRARFWTRAAIAVTTLIIGVTALTTINAPTGYEPPIAPGQQVDGVPPHKGPEQLTRRDKELRAKLLSDPMHGPERLVPLEH